jgi:hypothetical protein
VPLLKIAAPRPELTGCASLAFERDVRFTPGRPLAEDAKVFIVVAPGITKMSKYTLS